MASKKSTPRKKNVPGIRASKRRNGADPLVMVTAYDYPSARVASQAGVDMILIGDSVGMVALGHDDTMSVTVDEMAHHIKAVARAKPDALLVADMPWMSFHVSVEDSVRNAATLTRAGGQCVKIEGGVKRERMMRAIIDAEMPVMAHIGLTPQSYNVMGGFKIQGKEAAAAKALVEEAKKLQDIGCFAVLIEGVPDLVGTMVTDAVEIPTIGIGAGPTTDGQVLVYHDIIGLENRFKPKFVRRYGTAFEDQVTSITEFASDVRNGGFPSAAETYVAQDALTDALGLYGSQPTPDPES